MASGPISSWQIDGETVAEFILGGSKITVDGDCSHEIKRRLLLGRKVMTNLDSILKSRDITLPTEVYLVKAMVFHVWMWKLDYKESWVPKNWCFWTVVLEKTLESPLDCKEIQPVHPKGDQSWVFTGVEGLRLKLKLQYFGHLMWRVDSLEKTLMLGGLGAGGEGDDRGWDSWMASLARWTWVWVNSGSWWWTGRPGVLRFLGSQRVRHDWVPELNWMEDLCLTVLIAIDIKHTAVCKTCKCLTLLFERVFIWPFLCFHCCFLLCLSLLRPQTLLCPHGLGPSRFICLWEFPGKNTEVGCCFLLQEI